MRTEFSMSGLTRGPVRRCRADRRQAPHDRPEAHHLRKLHLHRRGLHLLRPARANFDGPTFIGVKFDRAALEGVSLRGATLRDVSFRGGWSKKYYHAMRTMNFDGARMDKLTYAALKGLGVDPSNVTVV